MSSAPPEKPSAQPSQPFVPLFKGPSFSSPSFASFGRDQGADVGMKSAGESVTIIEKKGKRTLVFHPCPSIRDSITLNGVLHKALSTRSNSNIVKLDLSECVLDDSDLQNLDIILKSQNNIRSVILKVAFKAPLSNATKENDIKRDEEIFQENQKTDRALANIIMNCKLKSLTLEWCSAEDFESYCTSISGHASLTLNALIESKTLHKLKLCNASTKSKLLSNTILGILKSNEKIKHFKFVGDLLPDEKFLETIGKLIGERRALKARQKRH